MLFAKWSRSSNPAAVFLSQPVHTPAQKAALHLLDLLSSDLRTKFRKETEENATSPWLGFLFSFLAEKGDALGCFGAAACGSLVEAWTSCKLPTRGFVLCLMYEFNTFPKIYLVFSFLQKSCHSLVSSPSFCLAPPPPPPPPLAAAGYYLTFHCSWSSWNHCCDKKKMHVIVIVDQKMVNGWADKWIDGWLDGCFLWCCEGEHKVAELIWVAHWALGPLFLKSIPSTWLWHSEITGWGRHIFKLLLWLFSV